MWRITRIPASPPHQHCGTAYTVDSGQGMRSTLCHIPQNLSNGREPDHVNRRPCRAALTAGRRYRLGRSRRSARARRVVPGRAPRGCAARRGLAVFRPRNAPARVDAVFPLGYTSGQTGTSIRVRHIKTASRRRSKCLSWQGPRPWRI